MSDVDIRDRSSAVAPMTSLILLALALATWGLLSPLWGGGGATSGLVYAIAPLLILGGVFAGGQLAVHPASRRTALVLAAACVLAASVMLPFYANAHAALGVQFVALAGLVALQHASGHARAWHVPLVTIALLGVQMVGVLSASRSQAATLIAILIAVLTAMAVFTRVRPSRRLVGAIGAGAMLAAALFVVVLGSLPRWPASLNAGESLSSARHRLWHDALQLWSSNPLQGGGSGAFLEHSSLARSQPLYERAHSSVLQIGAELGTVGVVLFLGLLVAGVAVAAQGAPRQALIGVAAWSALGVHSMIDHLYEYPLLALTAGVVIGWAGRTAPTHDDPRGS